MQLLSKPRITDKKCSLFSQNWSTENFENIFNFYNNLNELLIILEVLVGKLSLELKNKFERIRFEVMDEVLFDKKKRLIKINEVKPVDMKESITGAGSGEIEGDVHVDDSTMDVIQPPMPTTPGGEVHSREENTPVEPDSNPEGKFKVFL